MSNDPTESRGRDTHPAPPEDPFPFRDEPVPPTNRGRELPPEFVGTPPPVPPPGAATDHDIGGLIARMEATLDDIEGAAAALDASSKLFVGQARVFHQEVRLWMTQMEGRVASLEAWRESLSDDGR